MLEAAAEFSDFVRFATSIFSRKGPVRINALQDLAFGGKGPVLTVQFVATCAFDITFLVVGDCCRLCTSVVPSSVSNVLKLLFIKLSLAKYQPENSDYPRVLDMFERRPKPEKSIKVSFLENNVKFKLAMLSGEIRFYAFSGSK